MKRDRNLSKISSSKKMLLLISAVSVVALMALGMVLIITAWGEASGKLERSKCEENAFKEAKEMIPETSSLEYIKIELGESEGVASFNLKDNKGKAIGVISADRVTGQVVYFYDARKQGPSEKIKISEENAQQIAEDFLRSKGIELGASNIKLKHAALENKGMEGSAGNLEAKYQYSFTFYEMVNGIPISGGSACFVCISPEDGRVFSYGIGNSISSNANNKASKASISKEDAIGIAKEEATRMADVPRTKPYISDNEIALEYTDFGDGELTPVWYIILHFGGNDVTDMIGVTRSVYISINANTGKVLSVD